MKIGFDAKRLFNNFTGLGNYSRFTVSSLARYFPDNEYLLYTPKVKYHQDSDPFLNMPGVQLKAPPAIVRSLGLSSWWRSVSLSKVASKDQVDLFHGLSNELPLVDVPNLKKVVTVHDLIFRRFPEFYNPVDVRIYSWKLKRACALADKIVAISQQTADDLTEFMKIPSDRIQVVYQGCLPGFKTRHSGESLAEIKNKYHLPDSFILNVGTIEPRKNTRLIVEALTHLKNDIPVVLVGRATAYMAEMKMLITKHRLDGRVIFIHNARFEDLPKIYQLASVFVYPSLFEGFGIPIIEAIASGVPVITSRGSCFSEAGGPDSVYVDPTNAEALAASMDQVLENQELRNRMVSRSTGYITRFEPEQVAADLMGLYIAVVGK
jgi:glycosyltransferase involved in cell wall biosynthesis